MKMYVLLVRSGYEEKIRDELIEKGFRAAVPTEEMHIRSGGQWRICERLIFSGYVFVECDLTNEIYYQIKDIIGVIKFLGNAKAQPLFPDEQAYIKVLANKGKPIKASKIYTSPSGAKLIMSGFLRQYSDNVTWIDTRQRKAKLEITLYGRKKEIVLPAVEI